MPKIDPYYHLVNTIFDDKEIVIFLGGGASMEGTQDGKRFPGSDELIDRILLNFGFDPTKKRKRFDNFLTVIKQWEREGKLALRLRNLLDGEPGRSHYYLAALSIALFGECNALLYLTKNHDDLMTKAFRYLRQDIIVTPLKKNIPGNEFQVMVKNIEGNLNEGRPVIIKLFGDLTPENPPILRPERNEFEVIVEEKLKKWMKKPMIAIGCRFSDKFLKQILISSGGTSPLFLVNPAKRIPQAIKELDRVHHIKSNFSEFMSNLFGIIENREPTIIENAGKILESIGTKPELSGNSKKSEPAGFSFNMNSKIKILILAANPEMTPQLRLDEEVREIDERLLLARHRNRFKTHSKWAVRPRDLSKALLDIKPHIVHFTGHGGEKGILIEDKMGFRKVFSSKALAELFKLCAKHVKCVILNACYSAGYANAITKHIDYVIGMRKEIRDGASIEFAVGFYDALGAGRSVEDAFDFGRTAVLAKYPDQSDHLALVLEKRLDPFVYFTDAGKKYHKMSCSYLMKNKKKDRLRLSDAKKKKYEACKRCKPPK